MQLPTRAGWIPILSLLIAMMLWASSFIALKIAFRHYDPMVVIFGRMLVASLCFAVVIRRFKGSFSFRKGDIGIILAMTLCEPCVYFILEAKAVENTTASQAGMITAMMPLMVAIAAHMVLKERITGKTLFGFIIAIVGAGWLSVSGQRSEYAPNPALGNFLEFLAMICAAAYTIILKRLTHRYSPFFLTGIQAFVGSIFYFGILFLPSTALPTSFEPVSILSIIYLGSFITLGAYGCFSFGVSRIPASQASAFINLIPVFTVFFGWLILGEQFTSSQYMAALLVFAGVLISQKREKKETVDAAPIGTCRS